MLPLVWQMGMNIFQGLVVSKKAMVPGILSSQEMNSDFNLKMQRTMSYALNYVLPVTEQV